jgi:hypothetical protein
MPRADRWAPLVWLALSGCMVAQAVPLPGSAERGRTAHELGWYALSVDALPESKETPLALDWSSPDCSVVRALISSGDGPVWILVHGIGGVGPEWSEVHASLKRQPMRAVFHYRWLPNESMEDLVEALAVGIGRILQCAPEGPLTMRIFAHSAGGVLSAKAASRIAVPRRTPVPVVDVVTVASPMAGLFSRSISEDPSALFFNNLSTDMRYAVPARGVSVTHVRTLYPGDSVMVPAPDGHQANDPRALVPTARVFTLPLGTTHVGALVLVAQHFGDGDLEAFLAPLEGLGR